MTFIVAMVLAVLTFAFIAYPFFKRRARATESVGDEKLQELQFQRDTTYSMLKELEFDLKSGILADEDYNDLKTRYKRKAVSILRDIDNTAEDIVADADEGIERKLQPAKAEDLPDSQRLLTEIAQLDDDLESGKIDESVYRKLRAEKKSQLVILMQRAKGKSGNR
jgi:hypothetical protein